MMEKVRVRFAPSPTGPLHIGSARTALFNWLFARHHGGTFILRIEDTDRNRFVPEALDDFVSGLRWLGLDWDEGPMANGKHGPYFQSQRTDLYREWGHRLVELGHAYQCWCSAEQLRAARQERQRAGRRGGYDRRCRFLTATRIAELESASTPYVIRFKTPLHGATTIHDLIRDNITFEHDQLEDLILLKSDGFPTYHLANVVDDHFMKISHIVRADEWIPTAPLHALMYEAFGWEKPIYAHAPLILNPSGKGKLSKRAQAFTDGSQKVLVQVREFRSAGYLPQAVANFLCNVGWAFGDDREVFSLAEAIRRFDLTDIHPSPARLPYGKLEWLNGVYIRLMKPEALSAAIRPFLEEASLAVTPDMLLRATPLIQERIKTLKDAVDWMGFFFAQDLRYEPTLLVGRKMDAAASLAALRQARDMLASLRSFDSGSLEEGLRQLAGEMNHKPGPLFGVIRVAVTGQKVAPPLFGTLSALGRNQTLSRIDRALSQLERLSQRD